MEMDSFSLPVWPCTDSVFSCEGFFLLSFSQCLQILCKPWFLLTFFSCSLTCLAGTMPVYPSPRLSDSKALESLTLRTWVLSRCFNLNPHSVSHLNTLSVTLQYPSSVPYFALTESSISFNLRPTTWSQKSRDNSKKRQDYLYIGPLGYATPGVWAPFFSKPQVFLHHIPFPHTTTYPLHHLSLWSKSLISLKLVMICLKYMLIIWPAVVPSIAKYLSLWQN